MTIYLESIFQNQKDKNRRESQLRRLRDYVLRTRYAQEHHLESAIFSPENTEKKEDLKPKSPAQNYRKELGARNIPFSRQISTQHFPTLQALLLDPKTSLQKKKEINILLSIGRSIAFNFGFEAAYSLIEKVIASSNSNIISNQDFANTLDFSDINHFDSSIALSFFQGNYTDYITQLIPTNSIFGTDHSITISDILNNLQSTNPDIFYNPNALLNFIKDQIEFNPTSGLLILGQPEGIHEAWATLFNGLNQQQIDLNGNASTGNLTLAIEPSEFFTELQKLLNSANTPFVLNILNTFLQQLEIELGSGTLATNISSRILNQTKPFLTHYLSDALGVQMSTETAEQRKNFKTIAADYAARQTEKMLFGASLNHNRQSSVFPLSNTWEKDVWDFFIDQRLMAEYSILSCDLEINHSIQDSKKTLNDNLIDLKKKVNLNPTLYPPLQIYAALEGYYKDFIDTILQYNNIPPTKFFNKEDEKKAQIKHILKYELEKLNQIETNVQSRTQIGLNRTVEIDYLGKAEE